MTTRPPHNSFLPPLVATTTGGSVQGRFFAVVGVRRRLGLLMDGLGLAGCIDVLVSTAVLVTCCIQTR